MKKLIGACVFTGLLFFGWSVDIQFSAPEKMSKAFPPRSEIKIALESLETLAQSRNINSDALRSKYTEMVTLRYNSCIQNFSISRFDSIKKIKKLPINAYCLEVEDNNLLQYLSMNQVNIRLTQSELRPQTELGQKTLISQSNARITDTAVFSSKSGVAVLTSENLATNGRSTFISYDIKAGKKIAGLEPIFGAGTNKISLSPNGRVAAVPAYKGHAGNEVVFFDTETGNILGRVDDTIGVQAWLPEVSAALLKNNVNNTIMLVDFTTGKVDPFKIDSKFPHWAVTINSSASPILVGGDNAFYLVKNERTEYGLKSSAVKIFYTKSSLYNFNNPPILMSDGNAAFFTMRNGLVQYDINSGKESLIETYPFLDNEFKKLDEEKLLTKLSNTDDLKVFNVKDKTISAINDESSRAGYISTLNGRNGFMRIESHEVWIGEKLDIGQSKSLATLLAEKNVEDQIKQMIEKEKNERQIAVFGIPVEDEPQHEVPMPIKLNAVAGRILQNTFGNPVKVNSTPKVEIIKSRFLGSKIPANTKYEFIGVKESANTITNDIQVTIQKTSRPILLILSSCKTVNWKITKQSGSRLIGVFQQIRNVGQPFSSVALDDHEYVTEILTRFNYCANDKNSTEYKTLEREILEKDGKAIERFQSSNSGVAFSVGN